MSVPTPVILIVEDELPLLEAIVQESKNAGFQAVSARSVPEAMMMLKEVSAIDAVWVDHFLPEHIGLELVEFMRRERQWASTPIFLVTNAIEPEIINKYMKAGIQGYYTKMLMSIQEILFDIKNRLTAGSAAGSPQA